MLLRIVENALFYQTNPIGLINRLRSHERARCACDCRVNRIDVLGRAQCELRETTIAYPYIIRYRVERERIVILRVRRGARLR